ncbi:MAG TPA: hypothetical protein VNS58_13005 [Puia sp.]|nr:hypothetical protein [Puia sp.]
MYSRQCLLLSCIHRNAALRLILTAVLIGRIPLTVNCQTDTAEWSELLKENYADKAPVIWKIGNSIFSSPDSFGAFKIVDALSAYGQKNNNVSIILEADLQRVFYRRCRMPDQQVLILNDLNELIDRGKKNRLLRIEACARDILADYCWQYLQDFETAFEAYNQLDDLLRPVALSDFPDKARMLYHMGNAYYEFHEYPKAIYYYLQVPLPNISEVFARDSYFDSRISIAEAYRTLNRLDSSDYYYQLLIPFAEAARERWFMGAIKGGLGKNKLLRHQLEAAIPDLQYSLNLALTEKNWRMASEAQMQLAELYFQKNQEKEAAAATLAAVATVRQASLFYLYESLYPLLNKMYVGQHQAKLARVYMDSTLFVKDSLARKFNGILLARILEKKALFDQQREEKDKKIMSFKLFALLACLLLMLVSGLFLLRTIRQRHRRQQLEKEELLSEKATALLLATTQLEEMTHDIVEKNELIEKLIKEKAAGDKDEFLTQLYQTTILTTQDWEKFRILLDKVYPGYLTGLLQKIPGITTTELKFLALARLNLSNKEIASSLGVTSEAIRVTWHRLRKKMNLPADSRVNELIINM